MWAIEPGEQAANYLERSVAANGYTHVDVVRCALSAADGSGFLQTGITPELRRLVRDDSSAAVGVRSLDSLATERRIDRVDFMKIDVEGEECNAPEGAAGFLASESPLLMIEFWGDRKFNEEIFEPLLRHGYATFRLVPGINVLAPFYESEEPDVYQLNLFACKPARAAQLAEAGYLVRAATIKNRRSPSNRRSTNCFRCHLRKASCRNGAVPPGKIPAAVRVRRIWRRCAGFLPRWKKPTVQRRVVGRSRKAYSKLRALVAADFTVARGATFVRVRECLWAACGSHRNEPAPCSGDSEARRRAAGRTIFAAVDYQESLAIGADVRAWLLASAVEGYEQRPF